MLKRLFLLAALLLILPVVARAQCPQTTPNISLKLVNSGATSGWDVCANGNMNILDSLFKKHCDIPIGDHSGSAVTDAQLGPQVRLCQIPYHATILQVSITADAGTPSVIVGRSRCTTFSGGACTAETRVNLLSSALSTNSSGFEGCSNIGGTTGIDGGTTCSATLQNTALLPGDYLELVSGTAGGTAKLVTVHILYQVNS